MIKKNNVWHDTSSVWKRTAGICRLGLRSTKLIFVSNGQLNYTTVLDFFAPGMYDISYLNMQHLGAGHFFCSESNFHEIPAILYPRSITTDILESHRFL